MIKPNETDHAGPASSSTDELGRAAFEEWITAPPFERNVERCSDLSAWLGSYRDIRTDLAWQAWKESAKVEREACAKVCREIAILRLDSGMEPGCCSQVADMCNVAILKRSNAK